MEVLGSPFLERPNFCKFFKTGLNIPKQNRPAFTTFILNSLETKNQRIPILRSSSRRRNSLRRKLIGEGRLYRSDVLTQEIALHTGNKGIAGENLVDGDNDGRIANHNAEIGENDNLEDDSQSSMSELVSKLENWASQYKEDIEYWGIGSSPIFTVYHDSDGNIQEVRVNEDEILERHKFQSPSTSGNEGSFGVYQKILRARSIAKDIKAGNHRISKHSSIVQFMLKESAEISSVAHPVADLVLDRHSFSKISRFAFAFLCGYLVFDIARKFLWRRDQKTEELKGLDKEMLARKIKARREREKMEKGSVEVVESEDFGEPVGFTVRPQLDKEEVLKTILSTKTSQKNLLVSDVAEVSTKKGHFNDRIMEIQRMARDVRVVEKQDASSFMDGREKDHVPNHSGNLESQRLQTTSVVDDELDGNGYIEVVSDSDETMAKEVPWGNGKHVIGEIGQGIDKNPSGSSEYGILEISIDGDSGKNDLWTSTSCEVIDQDQDVLEHNEAMKDMKHGVDEIEAHKTAPGNLLISDKKFDGGRPRIIMSVEEANKYLLRRRGDPNDRIGDMSYGDSNQSETLVVRPDSGGERLNAHVRMPSWDSSGACIDEASKIIESSDTTFSGSSDRVIEKEESDSLASQANEVHEKSIEYLKPTVKGAEDIEDTDQSLQPPSSFSLSSIDADESKTKKLQSHNENWIEANFEKFEPIITKMGVGFKNNYMLAKERGEDELTLAPDVSNPSSVEEEDELEWMKDDALREIVFKVRENEMAGRDPFYLMDVEDQDKFFKGLEKKVDKANSKLLALHEWIHSRVENLDYGADGISIYDPPEKVMPRWKGPVVDKDPEFLKEFNRIRREILGDKMGTLSKEKLDNWLNDLEKMDSSASSNTVPSSPVVSTSSSDGLNKVNHKTVIESSDGSMRPGTKSGKEYWQHTKKWSEKFLQVYNAETDPEVKAIMRDMGKDLDKWITPKEIQEAADLRDRHIPKKKKRYIEKKLAQLKRECERFGPQAVADKYREYADEKQEDCLWWLDLPFVLCIELYMSGEGYDRIGFYSLEMGADFELDPKQYHVVAFEDRMDARHFCYIVQTHMEIIGNGHAFVIARPPKDAFREARANGFSVTVIKKGELQLNIDRTLEEVESEIVEIGSKMYYDKYIRENEVSMEGIWKGLFKGGKTKKRPMRTLTKSIKGSG
ncbi:uncharacterized protein LOC116266896 [Nymphaea colorata]|nr:uncharacterized protein LOC116266896 [Nymphaea colorata]